MVRLSSIAFSTLAILPAVFGSVVVPQSSLQSDGTARTMESWDWEDCGSPTDALEVKSIAVSPDPPKPGKDLTVTAVVNAHDTIDEGAYADVVVKLGLIKLLQKQFDLCEEARNANISTQCPVKPGEYTIEYTTKLPREIPQAKFNIAAKAYTVNDDDLFCLRVRVDFMRKPF